MIAERNLVALLKNMQAELIEGLFVFVTLPDHAIPTSVEPCMIFREAEGTTMILRSEDAAVAGLDWQFPCRMITLKVFSSLDAVGFIAHIATELSRADISVNPVAGFFHDHLFIPEGREGDAMRILGQIVQAAAR